MKKIDPSTRLLKGKFGLLRVIEYIGPVPGPGGHHRWLCVCECGVKKPCRANDLLTGTTKSCGCLRRKVTADRSRTHNRSKTPDYHIWGSMVQRCHCNTAKAYRYYGGRGITVCDRWRFDFATFMSDMGPRPSGYSIERKENDKGYSPENCLWIPRKDQPKNTRRTVWITFDGVKGTVSFWAKKHGLKPSTITARIRKGWTHKDAASTPALRLRRKHHPTPTTSAIP